MGGAVAVGFTEQFPALVKELVLLAPAGFVQNKAMECFRCCNCIGTSQQ
jgi:hypothetical protein